LGAQGFRLAHLAVDGQVEFRLVVEIVAQRGVNLGKRQAVVVLVADFVGRQAVRQVLGTDGYSPRVLRRAVRQAGKAASFQEAREDLRALTDLAIGTTHLQRLSERIGREWQQARAAETQQYQQQQLPRSYAEAPAVAAVMLDGGR